MLSWGEEVAAIVEGKWGTKEAARNKGRVQDKRNGRGVVVYVRLSVYKRVEERMQMTRWERRTRKPFGGEEEGVLVEGSGEKGLVWGSGRNMLAQWVASALGTNRG